MISLTSFSPNVAIPLSIFFSSGEDPSSVAMSTAVERSLKERVEVFLTNFLSMKDVDPTNILLNGLKTTISTFNTGAINTAIDFALFEA